MSAEAGGTSPRVPLDRADVRVRHEAGLAGSLRGFVARVRAGDLGALPVVVGLVLISAVFQSLNPVFLSSNNLVNLLFDSATTGIIALGIVLVLMVGEIDLSVGSVSGFASALVGVLWVNQGWPAAAAILVALAAGGACGAVYALLFNGSACRASSRRWRGCSRCWACSSSSSAPRARSTCPTNRRWWISARRW